MQFFDSIYREADFAAYKTRLKQAVKKKIERLKAEIEIDKKKLANTSSAKTKKRLKKSIDKKKANITSWKKHLTSDPKLKDYYLREWRTFHGSDHLPLWVQLEIDFSGAYLDKLT